MLKFQWTLLMVSVLIAGCGESGTPDKPKEPNKQVGSSKLILTEEPAGAKGVIDVKKQVKDGDEVVVLGRIGGSKKPFSAGRAAFTIVDDSLKSCSDIEGDNCAYPWDYCCEDSDDLAKATVLVKFVDDSGKTLAQDAKESLGLKELQTVVVRGIARRDGEAGFCVVAGGVFIKK